jgi:hypothetical protein
MLRLLPYDTVAWWRWWQGKWFSCSFIRKRESNYFPDLFRNLVNDHRQRKETKSVPRFLVCLAHDSFTLSFCFLRERRATQSKQMPITGCRQTQAAPVSSVRDWNSCTACMSACTSPLCLKRHHKSHFTWMRKSINAKTSVVRVIRAHIPACLSVQTRLGDEHLSPDLTRFTWKGRAIEYFFSPICVCIAQASSRVSGESCVSPFYLLVSSTRTQCVLQQNFSPSFLLSFLFFLSQFIPFLRWIWGNHVTGFLLLLHVTQ